MQEIKISAGRIVNALVNAGVNRQICILDSSGVGHLGSRYLVAGIDPVETINIALPDAKTTLNLLEEKFSVGLAGVFTLSYNLGLKLQNIPVADKDRPRYSEPDIYLALFESLIVHDYSTGKTEVRGKPIEDIENLLKNDHRDQKQVPVTIADSNLTRDSYIQAVETIQEYIRRGETYQTNLTQQFSVQLPTETDPADIFFRLRENHPAPFAAFIRRAGSSVISASPERFFKVTERNISTSPIKGTRRRGSNPAEDDQLRNELLTSVKDRAENTMIVDLLRNDLGRVCEFGSVTVDKLCDLEEHPTLFHLVSTVSGMLREDASIANILEALFPCGSITGAPKVRTMQIIEKIETASRGLSMGAIGFYIPPSWGADIATLDLNVAIRTIVIDEENKAVFNVGGGIVVDSDPEKEYEESLLKAKALLSALGARPA